MGGEVSRGAKSQNNWTLRYYLPLFGNSSFVFTPQTNQPKAHLPPTAKWQQAVNQPLECICRPPHSSWRFLRELFVKKKEAKERKRKRQNKKENASTTKEKKEQERTRKNKTDRERTRRRKRKRKKEQEK